MCVILTLQSCTQIKVPFQVPLWYNSPCNHRGESTTKVPYLFPMMGKQLQKKNRPLFRGRLLKPLIYLRLSLLAEVALQQAFESLAVAGFVASHFIKTSAKAWFCTGASRSSKFAKTLEIPASFKRLWYIFWTSLVHLPFIFSTSFKGDLPF